jgi:hypothetical protein
MLRRRSFLEKLPRETVFIVRRLAFDADLTTQATTSDVDPQVLSTYG